MKVKEFKKGYLIDRGDGLGYWQRKPDLMEEKLTDSEEIIIELCKTIQHHENNKRS